MSGASLALGVAAGVVLTLPVMWWWTRRTERRVRQAEQRARTTERLTELGTMTRGLAHEIKNPLSTIGLNMQLLREDVDDVAQRGAPGDQQQIERVQKRLTSLDRETKRLREILDDFLRFAGRMELDRQPTDVNALVAELVDFFEPQAQQAAVHVRTDLQANPPDAEVDAGLLKQALLNLLINATQAMTEAREKDQPHGGARDLIVRTERSRPLDEEEIHLHITDTGPGMDETLREKIFQPYFSTKRGGTGLGLPTTRRVIEEHGGRMSVHSEIGRGTDFTLALPVQAVQRPSAPAASTTTTATGASAQKPA
jgi:signal transduction histidine kinase